ncbi:MAG: hypothetical protein PUI85_02355 [Eubacteriales bacterium]|nr:hypothetical protein [Eubacteriales bacterium]MDY3332645.1 hypothetical protein [Gallibacter sp.]
MEKKLTKRLFGAFLAFAMVLSVLPWQVMANEPSETSTVSVKVVYENGKSVENGKLFSLDDRSGNEPEDYEVKDGVISGLSLVSGKEYRLGISWNNEDADWGFDHKIVEADPALETIPVTLSSKGDSLVWYDRVAKKPIEDRKIETVTLKYVGDTGVTPADPPKPPEKEKVVQGKPATVSEISVIMDDGTQVPDGVQFDLVDMKNLFGGYDNWGKYYVKNGKISGIKMDAEQQYKIGMDVKNPFYKDYIVLGGYKSQHFLRIYARYNNDYPLVYDYDEGITGKEDYIKTIVLHKVKDVSELDMSRPTSCIMTLMTADGDYAAEGGLPFRLIRKDNGKSKVVYSKEGELPLIADAGVAYELKLDPNETYTLDEKIEFTIKMDKEGKYQPVLKGYDVEDEKGHLQCRYLRLTRKDGKTPNSEKPLDGENGECQDCTKVKPSEYAKIFETEKVILKNMPVYEVVSNKETKTLNKAVTFLFYNATTQTVEKRVTSKNGIVPDVELTKGHNYIVYAEDADYEMPNSYMVLNKTGDKPVPSKQNNRPVDGFYMTKRPAPINNPLDAKRVTYMLPVYYTSGNGKAAPAHNVNFKFVSPYEEVKATAKVGAIEFSLIEDMNYMVYVDDVRYSMDSIPMTIKDKSEWGREKFPFNHLSCGSVNQLVITDKTKEGKNNDTLVDYDNTTRLTGMHFGNGSYLVSVRTLPKETVKGLEGKDYEVLDIDTINMYRTEISKLAKGNFKVSRVIPEGKKVRKVYYVDGKGELIAVPFTQDKNTVTFEMTSMSIYNNVIEYGEPEVAKASDFYVASDTTWNGEKNGLVVLIKSKIDDENIFNHFNGVEIDGKLVDPKNYVATKGSVRIAFNADYLMSLTKGKHNMKVLFDNASFDTEITIAGADTIAKSNVEKAKVTKAKGVNTGDANGSNLVGAFIAAMISLVVAGVALRKKVK